MSLSNRLLQTPLRGAWGDGLGSWSILGAGGRAATAATTRRASPASPFLLDGIHCQQQRSFARGEGGSRGARGHGWYTKYRSGRGGRHLQGEYHDRESPEDMVSWNDAILALGSQRVYMDIVMEPRRGQSMQNIKPKTIPVPPLDELEGKKLHLEMEIATTVMPETTQNFIDLLQAPVGDGYKGTRLYRIDKAVGLYFGDVLTNTGKTGKAFNGDPLTLEIKKDPLAMWHIPGTISMLVPKVGEVDSRFLLCAHAAPHVDGMARAFGRLTPESLVIVTDWVGNLMTRTGIPTAYDLIVVDCGLLESSSVGRSGSSTEEESEGKVSASASA